jgi:GTPase SAR1 family protein
MDIPNPAYNKSAAAGLQNEEELNSISEEEKELRILLSKPFLRVRCQIWDTAGQEKFHVITRAYYRGAHAIVCTYDVTDSDSFRNIDYWLANIHTHTIGKGGGDDSDESGGSGAVQTMIIGNKTDLHHKRTVTKSQGEALAKECGVTYIETSAKDGTNVNDAFQRLATDVVAQLDRERRGAGKQPAKKRGSKVRSPCALPPPPLRSSNLLTPIFTRLASLVTEVASCRFPAKPAEERKQDEAPEGVCGWLHPVLKIF